MRRKTDPNTAAIILAAHLTRDGADQRMRTIATILRGLEHDAARLLTRAGQLGETYDTARLSEALGHLDRARYALHIAAYTAGLKAEAQR